jgi:predicted phage terminase large subunit-like protein
VAPTFADARTVCIEGEAGILAALGTSVAAIRRGESALVEYYHMSRGVIGLRNGHVIYADSADDGGLRIQGKNLRACWADELGLFKKWRSAWDESVRYAVRKGASRIIATGTPKVSRPAAPLIRRLLAQVTAPGEDGRVISVRLRTRDNLANLSQAFRENVIDRATGTRLERQELEGVLLDDVDNALWTRDLLERCTVSAVAATITSVTIGVDPSDGTGTSDEQAYTVAALANDNHLYVLESYGARQTPAAFARTALRAAQRWAGDLGCPGALVVEKNHGGRWLLATFEQIRRELGVSVPVSVVHASEGKRTRAEPVSALYERGVVRHVRPPGAADDHLTELEDQLVTFTGAAGERSPDRLDSLTWALSPYKDRSFTGSPLARPVPRPWAAQREMGRLYGGSLPAAAPARPLVRNPARAGSWDLDSFAPRDDTPARAGAAVIPWFGDEPDWD